MAAVTYPEFSRSPCLRFEVRQIALGVSKLTPRHYAKALKLIDEGEQLYLYHPYLQENDPVYSILNSKEDLELLLRLHGRKQGEFKLVALRKKTEAQIGLSIVPTTQL